MVLWHRHLNCTQRLTHRDGWSWRSLAGADVQCFGLGLDLAWP